MNQLPNDITIYVIRHGQSSGNLDDDAMATAEDAPLTEKGETQSLTVAKWFKRKNIPLSAIYSSSCARALTTSKIIALENNYPANNVIGVDALVELSVGDWSKEKISTVVTPEVERELNLKGIDFIWPGGESFRMVEKRMAEWLEREILGNQKYASGRQQIVIISHGNTIRALFHRILGCRDDLVHRFAVDNGSISIFEYRSDGWNPVAINSTGHLA